MKTLETQIKEKNQAIKKAIDNDQFELAAQLKRDLDEIKLTNSVRQYAL